MNKIHPLSAEILHMSTEVRDIFLEKENVLVNSEERHILVSHFGTFSQDLVNSLSNNIEELLISIGDKRMVIKRMFSILIEGLQNIRIHGESVNDKGQLGFLIIAGQDNNYKIVMANIIPNDKVKNVGDYLDKINAYSDVELKETYLNVLSNEFLSQKGGAGLGLITTRMKSGNPLQFSFHELEDDMHLFVFEVVLDRKDA